VHKYQKFINTFTNIQPDLKIPDQEIFSQTTSFFKRKKKSIKMNS